MIAHARHIGTCKRKHCVSLLPSHVRLIDMIGITLTPSELEMVGPSYFSKLINTAMGREGGPCSSNRISSIILIKLLTNPAHIHMFAVRITRMPLASNNCALRPFAILESAFLAS
ncbi:hypothetical protein RclHR1_20930007 [Rhizophagus clarus]|uniref:Uncharacterized protein n=1 Tax=Rhizophagus clarus TaxID=94130 RepID=A0A2Z6R598_9GLOM|nr:hypothetical protein RclHR1_20930007 [Rhizophagus clarus]GES82761.1 hypothetical protein RCL_jg11569.t1 [Rhizophagus clarus]